MSRFESLEVQYTGHCSDCDSNCSIHQAMLNPTDYRNWNCINLCGNYWSISSGRSDKEIQHSAQHWTECHVLRCSVHEENQARNKVYVGSLPSITTLASLNKRATEAAMATEPNEKTVLSTKPCLDLSQIKGKTTCSTWMHHVQYPL